MKVELTGYNRYYSVECDDGKEYLLVEMYDANSQSTNYEIMVDGESLDDATKRVKVVSAFINHLNIRNDARR